MLTAYTSAVSPKAFPHSKGLEDPIIFDDLTSSDGFYGRWQMQKYSRLRCLLPQRFGELFIFGLVWQYSSVQTKYNKGRFKGMATYLQQ